MDTPKDEVSSSEESRTHTGGSHAGDTPAGGGHPANVPANGDSSEFEPRDERPPDLQLPEEAPHDLRPVEPEHTIKPPAPDLRPREPEIVEPPKDSPLPVKRAVPAAGGGARKPPPPPPPPDDEDGDDEGMVRMSFMGHLEELRSRIIKAVAGLGVAFLLCVVFCYQLWDIVRAPAVDALTKIGAKPVLVITEPMENFSVIWVKVPLVISLFVGSPWILYQVWGFIAPGLYKRERRWAVPFIATTAGLFITGGLFAYFVAFRYGLAFLLGIGLSGGVEPMVTITNYFDLFVDVILGVSLVFELPVVIFFLTLLRIASPRFLMAHSRYAILGIVILAAIITPTPDVFNLMLFAVPMSLLFFVGVFASYLLVLKREGKKFPWGKIFLGVLIGLAVIAGIVFFVMTRYHLHLIPHWPFLMK